MMMRRVAASKPAGDRCSLRRFRPSVIPERRSVIVGPATGCHQIFAPFSVEPSHGDGTLLSGAYRGKTNKPARAAPAWARCILRDRGGHLTLDPAEGSERGQ
jgi:hypothetical protein